MDTSTVVGTPRLRRTKGLSFFNYLQSELRRGYLLENDEERYAARREKVYTFFKIPREIEKFLAYGFLQSADSFLFVLTFLPIRFILALWCLITRPLKQCLGFGRNISRYLKPAEIVDLLKGTLLIICCYLISYIDTSVCYHMIKTQSTIKLYLFFNMLEIADRLMSAFGQDTLDALFWTATEPRGRKREHFGVFFHLIVACIYVALHSLIVLLQALTLNVAINSDNKGLLTIVISNNFVELKGAVFKKFDRNNLLQISCSDVRERFHICVLLFVVVIQTMKEYSWKEERLGILLPDCFLVFGTEVLIDWLKHAFITRFNDIPVDAYRDYTLLIASDLITCKQKYAYSDHSDLVARRMGFIPLPLGVVIYRILSQSLKISNVLAYLILIIAFLCLLTFRVLNGIIILGKACDLINTADIQRSRNVSETIDKTNTPKTGPSPLADTSSSMRSRRRTVSKDSEPQIREMVESVIVEEQNEVENAAGGKASPIPLIELKSSDKSPNLSLNLAPSSEKVDLQFKEVTLPTEEMDKAPTLTFLGECQSGLMANSMVNLSSVGLNQGVSDHDATTSIMALDSSPDVSSEPAFPSLTQSDDGISSTPDETGLSLQGEESGKEERPVPNASRPFTSTRSCPCLGEMQSLDDTITEEVTSQTGSRQDGVISEGDELEHVQKL